MRARKPARRRRSTSGVRARPLATKLDQARAQVARAEAIAETWRATVQSERRAHERFIAAVEQAVEDRMALALFIDEQLVGTPVSDAVLRWPNVEEACKLRYRNVVGQILHALEHGRPATPPEWKPS